ncbi:MAG: 50S ribosomal protein L17 [Bdellovibrionales bacterium]|nr:50S ribosomal protein L17 [Bdellovibrionales bacterium]
MRHSVVKHSFGRKQGPRKALIRGLVDSLVQHGRIKTTLAKAKELRRHVEKAVTYGKEDSVHVRRTLLKKYPNKDTVKSIVTDISPRFKDRPGGYTRILKIGARPGDMAPMALIEFVDYQAPEIDTEQLEAEKRDLHAKRLKMHKKSVRKMQASSRVINRK